MVAVVLLGVGVMLPVLLSGSFPKTHDLVRYPYLLAHFYDALSHGIVYPRYLPNLNLGMGYPTFVYYQPLFFYLASPWVALGLGWTSACLMAVACCVQIALLGAFVFCKLLSKNNLGSVAAVAAFAATPYLWSLIYVRGAWAELSSFAVLPWCLVGLVLLAERAADRRSGFAVLIALAGGTALLCLSHPATFLVAVPIMVVVGLWAVAQSPADARLHTLGSLIITGLIALALGAVYWWTVGSMKGYVRLDNATQEYFVATEHLAQPWQLVARQWGFGPSAYPWREGQMSVALGLPQVLLVLAGLALGWRKPLVWIGLLLYAVLVFMMLRLASGIWSLHSPLSFIQFPWRLLTILASVQLLAWSGWTGWLRMQDPRRVFLAGVVGTFLVIWSWPQFVMETEDGRWTRVRVENQVQAMVSDAFRWYYKNATSGDEFLPITARMESKPLSRLHFPLVQLPPGVMGEAMADHSHHRIHYRASALEAWWLTINQYYLPGWRVAINGAEVPPAALESHLTPDGRIRVRIEPGDVEIRAGYEGPVGWRMRNAVVVVLVVGGMLWLWIRRHPPRHSAQNPSVQG